MIPLFSLALLGAQTGCHVEEAEAGGGHAHGSAGGGHAGGGGTHEDDRGSSAHSEVVYDSGFELFVEHPPLVSGEKATLSVHVSKVDGYEPADRGSVAVVLTGEEAPGERFVADEPGRDGLYEIVARPKHVGKRRMFVVYEGAEETIRFFVGEVETHESAPEHAHGGGHAGHGGHGDGGGGISFSKEQQWKVDFATDTVRERPVQPSVPARGIVRHAPDAEAQVRAPFPGKLRSPAGGMPDIGDRVERGAPVAVVAPTADANARPMLRADLSKAKSRLDRQKRQVERLEPLVERGAVAEKRLVTAESELEAARADVRAAEQRLRQYQSYEGGGGPAVTIRAPTSGRIVERDVTDGEYVEQGDLLARTADSERLRLEVRIAEANLGRVDRIDSVWFQPDGEAPVELGRTDDQFFTHIDTVDPETRTQSAWFGLPADQRGLAAGQYHRVRLRTAAPTDTPAVPATALLEEKGIWVVYVMTGPESFERRRVETGTRDGELVEITDGLEPGERVVTRGAYLVKLAAATSGVGGHHH